MKTIIFIIGYSCFLVVLSSLTDEMSPTIIWSISFLSGWFGCILHDYIKNNEH